MKYLSAVLLLLVLTPASWSAEANRSVDETAVRAQPTDLAHAQQSQLGTVVFPVSCNEAARPLMEHGLALLHHMLTYAAGDQEQALALAQLRTAAEQEAKQGGGAPSELIPVTELLGEMLLEMEQYEEALRAYEAVLLRRPNRLNSLVGAGRAAELAGNESAAATHYQRAVSLVTDAQGETARLQPARVFLAANPKP